MKTELMGAIEKAKSILEWWLLTRMRQFADSQYGKMEIREALETLRAIDTPPERVDESADVRHVPDDLHNAVITTLEFLESRFGNSQGLDWFDQEAGFVADALDSALQESAPKPAVDEKLASVECTAIAAGILSYLGFAQDPSIAPGADVRRDAIALMVSNAHKPQSVSEDGDSTVKDSLTAQVGAIEVSAPFLVRVLATADRSAGNPIKVTDAMVKRALAAAYRADNENLSEEECIRIALTAALSEKR